MNLEIIYEDHHLIAVNKPTGIPVYPIKKNQDETIADKLIKKFSELKNVGLAQQVGLVHRLDNGTSGVLVAARTQATYKYLRSIWNTDAVTKTYTALVLGKTKKRGTIEWPIAHHPSKKKKMMACETKKLAEKLKARPAFTEYETLQTRPVRARHAVPLQFSLLSIRITTGVRHQIRVHLASNGHPLVGDRLYQNPAKRKLDPFNLSRPFLHLFEITLPHPKTGKIFHLKASMPREFLQLLTGMHKLIGGVGPYI